jgi:hypothetical protein
MKNEIRIKITDEVSAARGETLPDGIGLFFFVA